VLLETPATLLEIRANAADVRSASQWLERQGSAHAIPPDQIFRLDLCLNEALANVIEHGGPEAVLAPVRLCLEAGVGHDGAYASLMISDAGLAFNPLTTTPKALPDSLAEASPGGLGLGLMRSFADEVTYDHLQGRNCLQFVVRWSIDQ
jgi:anti-sigma regulatory factor (Ser/Thr protein kinase)